MRRPRRAPSASPEVATGERVLARAHDSEESVCGTREALYLGTTRVPWERVQAADWDQETATLHVTEVGSWGEPRPVHSATLSDPGRLLELVRERVTASILLQRHVALSGRRGVSVVARRAPAGARELTWFVEYDEGIDPHDPAVAGAARRAVAEARAEVGET